MRKLDKLFNEDVFWRILATCVATLVVCGTVCAVYGTVMVVIGRAT